jgi:pilus assembly protein FimV
MKRPLQLSLAIALALGGTNAMALGLGPVHVKSKLNQPLDAEIPVIQGTAGEAEGLLVSLAAAEDFERVGIARGHLNIPLDFSVGKGANGQTVIRVTSKEPVRDSYLDFLVEANWPKGRLLREYTVLLDPPVTAPARGAPATSVASAPAPTVGKPASEPEKHAEKPAKIAKAEKAPKPEKEPAPASEAKPAPVAAAPRRIIEGEYGPTKAGETLSGIARSARPDSSVNMDQMMLALLKNNPNAFYKDNINALKRGAILRIPSADEAKAIGSASEAATQVRSQIEDWQGGRATPTRVAATPEKPASSVTTPAKTPKATAGSKSPSERLELVPPKAGKDSIAMADQPGSGGSAGTGAEIKRELARTKEALTARDQEAGELKSRVKELEDLKGKNDRLINLKDSEIADLQQKLKELQAKAEASAKSAATSKPAAVASTPMATATPASTTAPASTTKPAATPVASAPSGAPTIDKKDIWGDSATATSSTKPGETHAPTTPTGTAPAPAPTSAPVGTAPAATTTTSPAGATATASTSTPASATSTPAGTASTTSTPTAPSTTTAPGVTVTPLPASPPTTATTGTATKTAAATTAKKPAAPSASKATAVEPAWYEASWVKPAALGGGVLLVLLGLLGMRKRKPAAAAAGATRGSIADQFGDSPYHEQHGGGSSDVMEAEAASLRDQIASDPRNPGLYLELLSLYYAERDVARFEETAAEMRAYIADPHQPEWQEAQAMGQELAPHNPLFSNEPAYEAYHDAHGGNADTVERPVLDEDDFAFADHGTPAVAASEHESEFGFGLGNTPTPARAQPTVHVPVPAPPEDAFSFDDLPPLESPKTAKPATKPIAMESAPIMKDAPRLDDDFLLGEDAVGTKLDLAKAYMDMGDPDGARSMLEEVVAEGSDAQKAEAHRLISELR